LFGLNVPDDPYWRKAAVIADAIAALGPRRLSLLISHPVFSDKAVFGRYRQASLDRPLGASTMAAGRMRGKQRRLQKFPSRPRQHPQLLRARTPSC
jgi:hypothetical protein